MRVGPGYPDNDFRPSYNRCETGRYLRFHGYLDEIPDYIRSGNYHRDHPDPDPNADPNAVTCIHTCEHNCDLVNPEAEQAEQTIMTFKSSDDQAEAEESLENLNEVLEDEVEDGAEADLENPLTESQILEEPTVELDVNYDSLENINRSESEPNSEELNEQLTDMLECMRDINEKFRYLFHRDVIFNENWPKNLTISEKIKQYEMDYSLLIHLGINEEWGFPNPNTFQGLVYRSINLDRTPPPRVRRALSVCPCSPIPGPSNRVVPEPGTSTVIGGPDLGGPDPIELASSANFQLHPEIENRYRQQAACGHAILDRELEEHPTFRRLPRNPFQADFADSAYSETDERTYWGLLVRVLYRAEILNIQLINKLGQPNSTPQLTNAGDANTWRGMITRYKYLFDSMNSRE